MLESLGYIAHIHAETRGRHGLGEARQVTVGKYMFHKGLVVALQRYLADNRLDCDGDPEGVFGVNTAEALVDWVRLDGLNPNEAANSEVKMEE